MGRWSTGAETVNSALRISIKKLVAAKTLVKGEINGTHWGWTNGAKISIFGKYKDDEKWIQLVYSITDNKTGESKSYDYKIHLTTVPSNLGTGEVLYFLCPVSNDKCRILYKAYDSPIWKSRESYNNRLYYSGQLSSKLDRPNARYWTLKRRIDAMRENDEFKYLKTTYQGKKTKTALKIEKMYSDMDFYDHKRFTIDYLPLSLRNSFHLHLGEVDTMMMY